MKLDHPFLQLPLHFDAERLLAEVNAVDASAWTPHPQGYAGNFAMTLLTPNGINKSDALSGPMRPTDYLKQCPYLVETLQSIGGVWGRTRLMKLSGQAEVERHVDINYYWRERMRVHVPILTQPSVRFYCGEQDIHMAAGECWIFDTWRMHSVVNDDTRERIHLVADTVGSEQMLHWLRQARPSTEQPENWQVNKVVSGQTNLPALRLETVNMPSVMTPWEIREHFSFLFREAEPNNALRNLYALSFEVCSAWHALWIECGDNAQHHDKFRALRNNYLQAILIFKDLKLTNGAALTNAISAGFMQYSVQNESPQQFQEIR